MVFTMLTIRGFQWRGSDRVRWGGSAGKPALRGRVPRPAEGRSGLCISWLRSVRSPRRPIYAALRYQLVASSDPSSLRFSSQTRYQLIA